MTNKCSGGVACFAVVMVSLASPSLDSAALAAGPLEGSVTVRRGAPWEARHLRVDKQFRRAAWCRLQPVELCWSKGQKYSQELSRLFDAIAPYGWHLLSEIRGADPWSLPAESARHPGTPELTGGELDVMIEGAGLFRLTLPNGQFCYTRSGAFHQDAKGRLVHSTSYPLADAITIPTDANLATVEISPEGAVSFASEHSGAARTDAGTIQLATFANPNGLRRVDGSLFAATAASGEATLRSPGNADAGCLRHKWLEVSHVDLAMQLLAMFPAQWESEVNSSSRIER